MLKNDTLKNCTSRIGLYGSAPPPPGATGTLQRTLTRNYVCCRPRSISSSNVISPQMATVELFVPLLKMINTVDNVLMKNDIFARVLERLWKPADHLLVICSWKTVVKGVFGNILRIFQSYVQKSLMAKSQKISGTKINDKIRLLAIG